MKTQGILKGLLLATTIGLATPGIAQDEPIYGRQLMTEQERNEYQERMRTAKTAQEKERIRKEHHERMRIRAEERGVKLPDEPPKDRGMGQGDGQGMKGGGKGMGGNR